MGSGQNVHVLFLGWWKCKIDVMKFAKRCKKKILRIVWVCLIQCPESSVPVCSPNYFLCSSVFFTPLSPLPKTPCRVSSLILIFPCQTCLVYIKKQFGQSPPSVYISILSLFYFPYQSYVYTSLFFFFVIISVEGDGWWCIWFQLNWCYSSESNCIYNLWLVFFIPISSYQHLATLTHT